MTWPLSTTYYKVVFDLVVVWLGPVHVGANPVVHDGFPDHAAHADGNAASNQILHVQGDEQGTRPGTEEYTQKGEFRIYFCTLFKTASSAAP